MCSTYWFPPFPECIGKKKVYNDKIDWQEKHCMHGAIVDKKNCKIEKLLLAYKEHQIKFSITELV